MSLPTLLQPSARAAAAQAAPRKKPIHRLRKIPPPNFDQRTKPKNTIVTSIKVTRSHIGLSALALGVAIGIRLDLQYFLGRGGINDVSTASNSNLGSSASGAKYAFVVFSQFLSSRSGKSGL
jgi:hypothetical protein